MIDVAVKTEAVLFKHEPTQAMQVSEHAEDTSTSPASAYTHTFSVFKDFKDFSATTDF